MLEIDNTPSRPAATGRRLDRKRPAHPQRNGWAGFFLGARATGGDMYGFRMAQLPAPEYTLLQRLRKDVLGDGCTQRAAIATALRVTAEVVREGGARRVVQHYDEFRSVAPSERRDDLLPLETILEALAAPSRAPEPTSKPVAEEPTETVILRREVSVNSERFGPGRHVVPASKAAALRAIEAGR